MTDRRFYKRVLALNIRPRRFGFVVFEGPTMLLDCGAKSFYSNGRPVKISAAEKIRTLLHDYSPSAIVVRKREGHADRARILQSVQRLAREARIPVTFVSRDEIVEAFTLAEANKHGVASVVAEQFLALVAKLPPRRKCWKSEDYRMSIFDAAAMGVAYFGRTKRVEQRESATEN